MGVAETDLSGVVFCAWVDSLRADGSSWSLVSVLTSCIATLCFCWSPSNDDRA